MNLTSISILRVLSVFSFSLFIRVLWTSPDVIVVRSLIPEVGIEAPSNTVHSSTTSITTYLTAPTVFRSGSIPIWPRCGSWMFIVGICQVSFPRCLYCPHCKSRLLNSSSARHEVASMHKMVSVIFETLGMIFPFNQFIIREIRTDYSIGCDLTSI